MNFDFHTPPELIAAITVPLAADADTLVQPRPYPRPRHLDDVDVVWWPLTDAGWTITRDDSCYLATSPDEIVTFTYIQPPEDRNRDLMCTQAWQIEVLPDPDFGLLWYAQFHAHTPLHLIAAFAKALADPARGWWKWSPTLTATPCGVPCSTMQRPGI